MKVLFFLIIISQVYNSSFTQNYSGTITDKRTNEPIKYASIGIINKPYGTYADENGYFNILLDDFTTDDSIRISCIGFDPKCFGINDFIEFLQNGNRVIYLEEKISQLDEVTVYGKQYFTEEIGNKRSINKILIGFIGNRELGIIIKNDKKIFLQKVSFKLTMSDGVAPDSAIFRFNIYNIKDNLPHENILSKPVYFHLNKEQFDGTNEFDLSNYNISINGDFAATFENIAQYGGSRIYFAAWIKGCPTVYRFGSQGSWLNTVSDKAEMKLYQSLKLTVSYFKKENKNHKK